MEDDIEDCAVYCLIEDERNKVASSFSQFLRIVRVGLEMLGGDSGVREEIEEIDEESHRNSFYNDYDDSEYAVTQEQRLEDYFQELEDIDPDCVEAWR